MVYNRPFSVPPKLRPDDQKGHNGREPMRVAQKDKFGNLIKVWDSARQVCEELKYDTSSVRKALRGKTHTSYGFIWEYIKPESEEK